ncbi:TonB-dependent receptor [Sphingomonas sp. BIUV-7]|uniref:TonB-dependent receptor n=1 Tax=Sphingomonas natans TaxID=3063330 RepID=A0ABT8Y8F2_9SPHN|nr:TonB-dependent receptor [Sphingomonas sp. BIUV-7]MDO6414594.1 TonB-dependent receptor [Sphingomonas sp. BIUV-7]
MYRHLHVARQLLAGTAVLAAFPAFSQVRPPTAPAAGDAAPATPPAAVSAADANDIIVTAQRRSERLEAVPLSITAVSGSNLVRSGVTRFQDLGNIAAGVQVSRGGAFTQPSIRGVTTLTTGLGYENNVAVYIDGFYQSDTLGINGDLVNVADVQILKGPQGTLYGRNATGGAILVNTLDPSSQLSGNFNVAYARFNDKRAQAYLSGPLADDIGFSIAGYYRNSDGYIKDIDATGKKDFDAAPFKSASLRAKLKAHPFDGVKLTFGYNHLYLLDGRGLVYVQYANAPSSINALPGRATERNTASLNLVPKNTVKVDEGTLKSEVATGIGTLTSYTGYTHRSVYIIYDFDGSKVPLSSTSQSGRQKTFQEQADYNIDAIKNFEIVIGGLFYRDKLSSSFVPSSFGVNSPEQFSNASSHAVAAYADVTYHLTEKLFLTGGVRYSRERKHVDYHVAAPSPILPGSTNATFSGVAPRAVLRYEIAPRTNVYASFTEGFRSGTLPQTPQARPELLIPISPEKIKAYEVGFKTASRTIRFDTAAFYYDYRNLQVGLTVPDPTCTGLGCAIVNVIGNAPKARSYGGEASLTVTPAPDLNLRANGAYTHARYINFAGATGTGLNAVTNLNVPGQRQNWNGQQMARAPTWSGSLGADYSVPLAGGKITLSGNGTYTSSFVVGNASLYGPTGPAALQNEQRFRQKAYAMLNLSLNWVDASNHFSLGVYSENVTNTKYLVISSGSSFGSFRQYGEPVTYGVRAGYKF